MWYIHIHDYVPSKQATATNYNLYHEPTLPSNNHYMK